MRTPVVCALVLAAAHQEGVQGSSFSIEDLRTPGCPRPIEHGDHALITYSVKQTHSGEDVYQSPAGEAFHMVVGDREVIEGLNRGLVGACEGGVRRITVPPELGYLGFTRGPPMFHIGSLDDQTSLDFYVTVQNVTAASDFEIFTALNNRNLTKVLDMIEHKEGINAVDEWGATPLMLAVSSGAEIMVAGLLNAHRPRVNVNARKPSGHSALVYASTKKNAGILKALLQRGADPNVALESGWTPLHFAVKFGHLKNAQALIEYGANPSLAANDGTRPIDLVGGLESRDRAPFTKLLVEAADRWRASHGASAEL